MKQVFFQSSLPRAGSTLLQNILGQNPDFYVTPTSGVLELLFAARANYSNSPEFKAQDSQEMKDGFLSFCKNGLEGFYNGITDKDYIVDKSRGWGIHYNFLNSFYPNPKIICMVRDPKDIFTSMEKNFRKNQHLDQGVVNWSEMKGTTTEKRVSMWSQSPPIGIAFERLKQMLDEGISENIHFVKFEDLTRYPKEVMEGIYDFLEIPQFTHDFDNIEQITQEDDAVYGIFGDHNIRKQVRPVPSQAEQILGDAICGGIEQGYKWFYDDFGYI